MLLHTPLYLVFLTVVVILFWIRLGLAWRRALLLAASYLFYALFDLRFAVLLFALTAAVYGLGKMIATHPHPRRFAILSIAINLGLLGVFKYFGFFMGSLQLSLNRLGISMIPPGLSLLLPIGISFYTFQAISYTTDILKKRIPPAPNLVDFALYLAFFPKIIAGPLIRPGTFFQQLNQLDTVSRREVITPALRLLVIGLVKKLLVADGLAALGDVAFRAANQTAQSSAFPTPLYLQGFYLYAFQIYADFSGYTDIARASAALLGFSLPENFQQPYFSSSLTMFWNRWHISLTQWFRENLYFPLNRALLKATRRSYPRFVQISTTLITMALIGLWHGAAWTFIAWGVWHGILLSIEQAANLKPSRRWVQILQGLVTFHLVGIGWVLFRSDNFQAAGRFLVGMVRFQQMNTLALFLPPVIVTAVLVFLLDGIGPYSSAESKVLTLRIRPILVVAGIVLILGVFTLNLARGADARPFIYGQF